MSSVAANPYAPPRAHVDDVSQARSEADEIRQEHIKHEASIRSIGILYYLSGALMVLVGGGMIIASFKGVSAPFLAGFSALYLALGVLMLFVARGVRTLKAWARIATIVLAAIGLLGFPVGTLINAYILYLMLSKKGKRIFAEDYQDIVEATPHVKYRTSVVVWIFLGILLLAGLGVIAALALR